LISQHRILTLKNQNHYQDTEAGVTLATENLQGTP
jgi:hypothetical protein